MAHLNRSGTAVHSLSSLPALNARAAQAAALIRPDSTQTVDYLYHLLASIEQGEGYEAAALDAHAHLACGILRQTGLAPHLLAQAEQGEILLSCAWRSLQSPPSLRAARDGDAWRLDGTCAAQILAPQADWHVVLGLDTQDVSWVFVVPSGNAGTELVFGAFAELFADVRFTEAPLPAQYAIKLAMHDIASLLPHATAVHAAHIMQWVRHGLHEVTQHLLVRTNREGPLLRIGTLQQRLAALTARAEVLAVNTQTMESAGYAAGSLASALALLHDTATEALHLGGVGHYRHDSPLGRLGTIAGLFRMIAGPQAVPAFTHATDSVFPQVPSAYKQAVAAWLRHAMPHTAGAQPVGAADAPEARVRDWIPRLRQAQLLDGPAADLQHRLFLHYAVARHGAGSVGLCLASHLDIATPFLRQHGNARLQQTWLEPALAGEKILALAMTEPGCGSDLQSLQFSAVPQGESWYLNGEKLGITNLPFADAVIVLVRSKNEQTPFAFSTFLVPLDEAGVQRGEAISTPAYHGCLGSCTVNQVVLSADHILGIPGAGLVNLMHHLLTERLIVGARMAGLAHYILDLAQRYDAQKQARWAEHGHRIQAMTRYLHECARLAGSAKLGLLQSATLKYHGSRLLKELAQDLLDLAQNVPTSQAPELAEIAMRCWHEAAGLGLAGGSEEVMLTLIAQELERNAAQFKLKKGIECSIIHKQVSW